MAQTDEEYPESLPDTPAERLAGSRQRLFNSEKKFVPPSVIVAGLVCGGLASIGAALNPPELPVLLTGATLLLVLSYVPGVFVAAAAITGGYARSDEYALLRLADLPARQIVEVAAERVSGRLWLLNTVAIGYPIGAGIGLAFYRFEMWMLFSVAVWGITLLAGPALTIGCWIGFRWPAHASLIAALAASVTAALGMAAALGGVLAGSWLGAAAYVVGLLAAFLLRNKAEAAALANAEHCIDGRITL